ncbi:MAG: transcriptional regulator [Firmicutes bacterium]|nr:transcriptional regulator [Bacillota bacterium]
MAEIFKPKPLGDPTRVKILHALSQEELCVCDLAEVLEMNQLAISHHLRVFCERKFHNPVIPLLYPYCGSKVGIALVLIPPMVIPEPVLSELVVPSSKLINHCFMPLYIKYHRGAATHSPVDRFSFLQLLLSKTWSHQ